MVVSIAYAIVDKNAVVIHFRDTVLAYTTMLRPGGLDDFASMTPLTWMKDCMIIWIQCHGLIIVPGIDIAWIGVCSEIEKDVWKYDRNCSSESESCVHHGVCWWNKHYLRD